MTLPPALFLILFCFHLHFCSCTDTISSTRSITDSETIVSNNGTFRLGFFSPLNSTYRYVGVLYNFPTMTPVWVANRDKPLNDSFGSVTISEDGNLVVLDEQKTVIWSSNVSNSMANSSAQLLDTGNLILRGNSGGTTLWESFQHPTDSCLQGMSLRTDVRNDQKSMLTSWRSPSDPSIGNFSLGLNPLNIPEIFLWNRTRPCWRSGPWNGQIFIGVASMNAIYPSGFSLVDDREGSASLTFTYPPGETQLYFALSSEGILRQRHWDEGLGDWAIYWSTDDDECNIYGMCRSFGICDSKNSPICSCLHGFEPMDAEEWSKGNWTSGCVRRTLLKCDRNTTTNEKVREDVFLKFPTVKVPDFAKCLALDQDSCWSLCLSNCSCIAYAYLSGIGCMHWSGRLIDFMKFSGSDGVDVYVRAAYSELDNMLPHTPTVFVKAYRGKKRRMKVVIIITVVVLTIFIAITAYFAWNCMSKKRGRKRKHVMLLDDSTEIMLGSTMYQVKLDDLQTFDFDKLATATGDFQSANKLGEGGFGPVYKGRLEDGREIAVKRLSRSSGQGVEEFMNELIVISKLQHRNLVRLLGCCVEREETMLIYEYMHDGSLDSLLFDPHKQEYLDWSKRVNIIEGIARGLLYLHRDSRLKIIHRDLKASNILLDQKLNPKISDFGMARIFDGDKDQANTRRVVGTYGYMPPEYAMQGRFSEKSDVYSFGVLLLEIVSGRRNSSFYHNEHASSLLGFAWKLSQEENIGELIDKKIWDPSIEVEILRYIHVGLLCVQEFAKDRPTVSTILMMFSSEIVDLPTPKQPAFTERPISSQSQSSPKNGQIFSVNNASITVIEGR